MKKKVRYLVDQDTNHGKVKKGDELLVDAEVADLEVGRKIAEYVGEKIHIPPKNSEIQEIAITPTRVEFSGKELVDLSLQAIKKSPIEPMGQIETSLETPLEYKNWDIPREVIKPLPIKADEDKKDTTKVKVESKPVSRRKKRKKYTFNKS